MKLPSAWQNLTAIKINGHTKASSVYFTFFSLLISLIEITAPFFFFFWWSYNYPKASNTTRDSRNPFGNIFQDSSISELKLCPATHAVVTTNLDVHRKTRAIPSKAAAPCLGEWHSKPALVNRSDYLHIQATRNSTHTVRGLKLL